jgi:hypothetical protein
MIFMAWESFERQIWASSADKKLSRSVESRFIE